MSAATLEWSNTSEGNRIAVVTINRPDAANAFNSEVMAKLTEHFATAAQTFQADPGKCRALVLRGAGKHFSAGADLNWMQNSAKLSHAENVADAQQLTAMFEGLCQLPMPTITVVHGAAFGGAVGLAACADFCIAAEDAKFCLSEVRLGLLPAVILPYLARKLRPGDLRRLSLNAQVFSGQEACSYGLVQVAVAASDLNQRLHSELNQILVGGPQAQATLKGLFAELGAGFWPQQTATAEAIAAARTGAEGQAGLAAFFAKNKSPWLNKLPDDWTLS